MIKRGIRIIFRTGCFMALTAWIAVAVLWGRSYFRGDCIVCTMASSTATTQPSSTGPGRTFMLISGGGGVCLGMREAMQPLTGISVPPWQWQMFTKPNYPSPSMWNVLSGYVLINSSGPITVTNQSITINGQATLSVAGSVPRAVTAARTPPTTTGLRGQSSSTITIRTPPGGTQNYMINGMAVNVTGGSITFQSNLTSTAPGSISFNSIMIQSNTPISTTAPVAPTSQPTIAAGVLMTPPPAITGNKSFIYYTAGQPISAAANAGDFTRVLILPYWSILASLTLPAVLGIMIILAWLRFRRRVREGCCKVCGYDLRATPERCPECGTIAATSGVL